MPVKIPAAKSVGVERLKMQLRAEKIPFIEEHQFHPERKWRFDFIVSRNAQFRLFLTYAIEVDGGNRMVRKTKDGRHVAVGRHTKDADYDKLNQAAILGWRVLRFSPAMVKSGKALETIREALK